MKTERYQVLLVGVGGQGVLTAAKVLAAAAQAADLPAVVGQLHGMSQRGGAVECSVIFGRTESSFVSGTVAVVAAFEPLEAVRALPKIGPDTRVLINASPIRPYSMVQGDKPYPSREEVLETIRTSTESVVVFDGPAITEEVGVKRTLNMALLGALLGLELLPMTEKALLAGVEATCALRFLESNQQALKLGRRAGARLMEEVA